MNIYLINRQIEELLAETDPETGEVLFDPEQLNELIMEKEAATEDLALGYKNLTAEAAARMKMITPRRRLYRGRRRNRPRIPATSMSRPVARERMVPMEKMVLKSRAPRLLMKDRGAPMPQAM